MWARHGRAMQYSERHTMEDIERLNRLVLADEGLRAWAAGELDTEPGDITDPLYAGWLDENADKIRDGH